jgi:hypothetical protein
MKHLIVLSLSLVGCVHLLSGASAPPPHAWLPSDTVAVLTIPDARRFREDAARSSWGNTFKDPALAPFREALWGSAPSDSAGAPTPTGVPQLGELLAGAHGQLTLAITRNQWQPGSAHLPALVAVVGLNEAPPDPGDPNAALHAALSRPGLTVTRRTIRNHEFLTAPVSVGTLIHPQEVLIGHVDRILIACTDAAVLEPLLDRVTGQSPSPADSPLTRFLAAKTPDTHACGYLDLAPLIELLRAWATEIDAIPAKPDEAIPMPKRTRMLQLSGLPALRSAAFTLTLGPEGTRVDLVIEAPAAERTGLIKALELDSAVVAPPAIIPANTIRFDRVRLNLGKTWTALERMLTDLFPQAAGVLNLLFQTAGQSGEPTDLKAELLSSLGNDLMAFTVPQASSDPADSNAREIVTFLLGSPKPMALLETLRAFTIFLPPPWNDIQAQDRDGQRSYSVRLASADARTSAPIDPQTLTFTGSPGYVRITRSSASQPSVASPVPASGQALIELPGFVEATTQLGGLMSQGLLGYHDLRQSLRPAYESLRQHPGTFSRWLALAFLGPRETAALDRWQSRLRFDLLPPFAKIQHHFHFLVYAGRTDAAGFSGRVFAPNPPMPAAPGNAAPPPPPPLPAAPAAGPD